MNGEIIDCYTPPGTKGSALRIICNNEPSQRERRKKRATTRSAKTIERTRFV